MPTVIRATEALREGERLLVAEDSAWPTTACTPSNVQDVHTGALMMLDFGWAPAGDATHIALGWAIVIKSMWTAMPPLDANSFRAPRPSGGG